MTRLQWINNHWYRISASVSAVSMLAVLVFDARGDYACGDISPSTTAVLVLLALFVGFGSCWEASR